MNQPVRSAIQPHAMRQLWIFLGSMNLAITLLVVIAVAAVIGTVLQQNEPYTNYVSKFGPFWFEVFEKLNLYDVYGAPWFILLLGFLLASTSVCVYRNLPGVIRDMRHFRLDVQEKSLRAFHHKEEWNSSEDSDTLSRHSEGILVGYGYKIRRKQHQDYMLVAAMRGGNSRLGYLLTHIAIVVICVGGLIDSNLPLKIAEWNDDVAVETRTLPMSEVPDQSILPTTNNAFRGGVNIPEGSQRDFLFLNVRDGYLVQRLPFSIELEDFRIEHYNSGMPKSFESDLIIHDPELDEPLRQTIAVNHPWSYKGFTIFQASFNDGGSLIKAKLWPLFGDEEQPMDANVRVFEQLGMQTPLGERNLEMMDFKLFNIFPNPDKEKDGHKFKNYGPSVTFKLRRSNGEANEYTTYMQPVMLDERPFMMSGMRASPAEPFRYLHIPLDSNNSVERFIKFRARIQDRPYMASIIEAQTRSMLKDSDETMIREMSDSMHKLLDTFFEEGIDAVVRKAEETVEESKQQEAIDYYIKVLQGILVEVYVELLAREGVNMENGVDETNALYFDDALNALSVVGPYDAPVLLELSSFEHVEASGLQIAKAPGQNVVYFGFVMLMVGIFYMFYIHHRRLWMLIRPTEGGSQVLFTGTGHREQGDFDKEFNAIRLALRKASEQPPQQPSEQGNER